MTNSVRFVLLLLCILPLQAQAVAITEIAWMGSTESANHEWIELFAVNSTDVDGWTISANDKVLVELTGTIPGGRRVVLERTSDASAAGSAWLIYTGALANTGATLTVRDAAGAVVDRVVGGADWESVGGDNITKDTAQLTGSGWVTAVPTPGSTPNQSNVTAQPVDSTNTESSSNTNVSSNSNSSNSTSGNSSSRTTQTLATQQLTLPDINLQLEISAPDVVYVNQPVELDVAPSGIGPTLIDSLEYVWNFGDGETGLGKEVVHQYPHPGNYVVVVQAEYKRQTQFTRHDIVVLPVVLELVRKANGDIAIQNNSQTEMSLAGYRLVGNTTFTFPKHTIILPRSQIVLAKDKFVDIPVTQMVALYDQAGVSVGSVLPPSMSLIRNQTVAQNIPVSQSAAPAPSRSVVMRPDQSRYNFASEQIEPPESAQPPALLVSTTTSQSLVTSTNRAPINWPLYGLVGLLLFGIAAIYLVPRPAKDDSPWA